MSMDLTQCLTPLAIAVFRCITVKGLTYGYYADEHDRQLWAEYLGCSRRDVDDALLSLIRQGLITLDNTYCLTATCTAAGERLADAIGMAA